MQEVERNDSTDVDTITSENLTVIVTVIVVFFTVMLFAFFNLKRFSP